MNKKLFFLFALLVLKIVTNAQEQTISNIVDSFASKENFNGVILIAEKGKPIYKKAIGFRTFENKVPLKEDDIFELASVSKQFTAMVIMMLQERGKLQFDDSINQYVSVPYAGITIRHLLTHTSGLPDYQAIMDQYWDKSKVAGNEDIITYLNKYHPPSLFTPGEKYNYSNTGYVLLASIAEKAAGIDFIQFCNTEIFKKLGMKSTAIRTLAEKAVVKKFAIGHMYVPERSQFIRADSFPSSNYTIWLGNRKGPGRISSTAEDLLKWDEALYTDKLVKQTTLAEAFSNATLNDGKESSYGFGWDISADKYGNKIVSHNGDNPGYKTQIVRFLNSRRTLIVLCNNAIPSFSKMIAGLEDVMNN